MFDLFGNDRLTEWKNFRDKLETSQTPLEDVVKLWRFAPFVNSFLNINDPSSWPDPWHLILDGKFDSLAICLGMLYTLKLTSRFMSTKCEIHMSMFSDDDKKFIIIVDNEFILDYELGEVLVLKDNPQNKTILLWSK